MTNIRSKTSKTNKFVKNKNRIGYVFVLPFAIGFVLFVLIPIIQSIVFSLSKINLTISGYTLNFIGMSSYYRALFIDTNVRVLIVDSIIKTFTDLPIILAFSFFLALLLNGKFKGRNIARTIFFLPVIMSSGVIADMDSINTTLAAIMNRNTAEMANSLATTFTTNKLILSFLGDGMPLWVMQLIRGSIDHIYDIIISSGLQILIFLSGLNTISPTIFESSTIEGATGWENFWKITFPMMGPYILLNIIYTIVDSFTNPKNELISKVQGYFISFSEFNFGNAISWIYFGMIFAIIGVVLSLITKRVFYYE
jgi:ABC-type sugar transport system permease subunit